MASGTSLLLGFTRGSDMQWRMTPKTSDHMRLYNALLHAAAKFRAHGRHCSPHWPRIGRTTSRQWTHSLSHLLVE
jgi:hypothetical protein